MFIDKLKRGESGILLYGITPPKLSNTEEKIKEISTRRVSQLLSAPIDGLVIYDLQDESTRTSMERPFPFLPTHDPYEYAVNYLSGLNVPKIIYRSVGKLNQKELINWCDCIQEENCATVFVGVPSKTQQVQMKLSEAYQLWKEHNKNVLLGGVTIPERHKSSREEHLRIVSKMNNGCSFFISQCVFNVDYTKNVLSDLYFYCQQNGLKMPVIIFTLTTCGSVKTIDFMDWLGIHLPIWVQNELSNAADVLQRSVDLCLDIAEELIYFCKSKGIPFGINIESVSIRKDEIDASLHLLSEVNKMLKREIVNEVA